MASQIITARIASSIVDRQAELKRQTEQFMAQEKQKAMEVGDDINNDVIRGIFEVLVNISYVLFLFGFGLSIYTTTAINLIKFVTTPGRSVFLALLVLLALVIASIIKVYKTSKRMTPKLKKSYDLMMEILRGILYISIAIYFRPFVFDDPEDRLMILAFWSMVLAAILYVVRKVLKWYNFLVLDKDNLTPWQTLDPNSPLLLLNFAKFQDFLHRNDPKKSETAHVKGALIPEEDVHHDQIQTPHLK